VIGHIAAAAGPNDRNVIRRKHVRFVAAPAQRVDMRMLDKQENIRRRVLLLGNNELLLQGQCSEIIS
jgi:hypothetical protein